MLGGKIIVKNLLVHLLLVGTLFSVRGFGEGAEGAGGGTRELQELVQQTIPLLMQKALGQIEGDSPVPLSVWRAKVAALRNLSATEDRRQNACVVWRQGETFPYLVVNIKRCTQAELQPAGFAETVFPLFVNSFTEPD